MRFENRYLFATRKLDDRIVDDSAYKGRTNTTKFLPPAEDLVQPMVHTGPDESAQLENLQHLLAGN